MAFVKKFGGADTVCPEMPKILTKLTPSHPKTCCLGIANDRRPNGALAVLPVRFTIADVDLALSTNPCAGLSDIQAVGSEHIPKYRKLTEFMGDSLVQKPTTMPWGNRSLLFRDPDGNLVNVFTPVSAEAIGKFDT